MKVPLHFGDTLINLEIPEKNLAGFLEPKKSEDVTDMHILTDAIERGQTAFKKQVAGRTVGVMLPDGTRDLPFSEILGRLFPLMQNAQKLLFFICTGSHDPQTASNSKIIDVVHSLAASGGIVEYEVISHNCQTSPFSKAGVTRQGTEIQYNSRLDEVDVFVALSDVKHHYFAGYSNPGKNIVPGLCAYKTIEQNHSLTFDDRSRAGVHPWHPDPSRRNTPLAADLLEAMQSVVRGRPFWAFVVVGQSASVQWADFGFAETVSAHAFQKADEWNVHVIDPVDYMIVSPGGLPNDVDLYIAQRSLELATSVVRDGGKVLFLAACPNGIGSELTKQHFEKQLKLPPEVISQQTREQYRLFEHKPYRFAKLIQRLDTLWIHTRMEPSLVRSIHATPACNPQTVVNSWLAQEEGAKILAVDGANKLLLSPRP